MVPSKQVADAICLSKQSREPRYRHVTLRYVIILTTNQLSTPEAGHQTFVFLVQETITATQYIELCAMDEDASSAEAPLMRGESLSVHDRTRTEDGDLREQDLTSPSWFIWALTFSAGISGLLFGYE